jgi:hypothetical protein
MMLTYDRTAAAFNNPDHVAIVIHNYRWRISLAQGESKYDDLERKLAAAPLITAPTITISSDFDGPAVDGTAYAKKFSGKYSHRIFNGIGHNVPQEAPRPLPKRSSPSTVMNRRSVQQAPRACRRLERKATTRSPLMRRSTQPAFRAASTNAAGKSTALILVRNWALNAERTLTPARSLPVRIWSAAKPWSRRAKRLSDSIFIEGMQHESKPTLACRDTRRRDRGADRDQCPG